MKNYRDIVRNLTMLTQFGLSFITPTLMCLALSWWLNTRFGLGAWIYLPGFFFGFGGSGTVAYKLYLSIMDAEKKEKKKKKQVISFNEHE